MRDKVLKELISLIEGELRSGSEFIGIKINDRKIIAVGLQLGIKEDNVYYIPYDYMELEFVEICEDRVQVCDNISDYLFDKLEEIIEDINEENRIDAKDYIDEMDYLWNNSYKW